MHIVLCSGTKCSRIRIDVRDNEVIDFVDAPGAVAPPRRPGGMWMMRVSRWVGGWMGWKRGWLDKWMGGKMTRWMGGAWVDWRVGGWVGG